MITYEVQGKIAIANGSTKEDVNLTIPSTIDGFLVSKIEQNSFTEMSKLKKVIIPKSVKVIGAYSFANCPMLKEVILEEGVEVIEDWAFISCNIEKIVLPKSIKSIGQNAFLGNMCKFEVDEFIKEKEKGKYQRSHTNNRCAVFPLDLLEAKESINHEIIESRSKYINSQFDLIESGEMQVSNLDIPILFNHDEFMLAFYVPKKEYKKFSFDVASESKTQIGLYSENDPDFLVLRINLFADKEEVSSFYIKTPYLEKISLEVKDQQMYSNGGYNYYFLTVKLGMLCYGNGNISREFALNIFDDFVGKYQTEVTNGLITEDQFNEVKDTVDSKIIDVIRSFLTQIDGAPYYTYVSNILNFAANDDELDKQKINDYIFDLDVKNYNELSSYESLENICFKNVYDTVTFLETISGMKIDDLANKYNLKLTDAGGNIISKEEAESYKNIFMDLETNYNLHADFILYIYKEMQRLNNQFSILAFSA